MENLTRLGQKITLALLVSQSLFSASSIMVSTVSAIVILQLVDQNSQWAGVPRTFLLIGAATIAYPMGRIMDRLGRRRGLSLGYLLGIAGTLVTGVAVIQESLLPFLLGILFIGFTRGTADLGRYAAAEANRPERRARAISLVVLGGTVGSIVGPTLITFSGQVAVSLDLPALSGPWFATALFFLCSLLIINLFLRPDPQEIARQLEAVSSSPHTSPAAPRSRRPLRAVLRDPRIPLAMVTMIVGQLVMVLLMAITPVHMHLAHHHISAISLVVMAHAIGMYGLSFFVGWLVDTVGWDRMLLVGSGFLVSACLVSPLSLEATWLGVGLFLLGLGWNCCYVAGSSLLAQSLRPEEKGRIQGLNDSLINLTSATGSLGSGLVFAAMGFATMSWLSLGVALVPLTLFLFFRLTDQLLPRSATKETGVSL
ncbi:MAG: MFS transporter [Nitrospinota bacterium]|nr:MAG: MFS transporter [Nitrospinota bacterium]